MIVSAWKIHPEENGIAPAVPVSTNVGKAANDWQNSYCPMSDPSCSSLYFSSAIYRWVWFVENCNYWQHFLISYWFPTNLITETLLCCSYQNLASWSKVLLSQLIWTEHGDRFLKKAQASRTKDCDSIHGLQIIHCFPCRPLLDWTVCLLGIISISCRCNYI